MKIVAFGYRRGCGKDTLARMIQRELRLKHRNLRVNVVGFADQLKVVCYGLYGWLGLKTPQFYEDNPPEKDQPIMGLPCGWKTPRDVWIGFGNHARLLDEEVLLNALLKTSTCDILLIKDLRFPHEGETIHNIGGEVNRIDRPGTEGADGEPDTVMMDYKNWSNIYKNDGDLNALHKIASGIAERLKPN